MTSVARAIGRQLHAAGVRHVMGHPGGEVVDLIDGLRLEGLEFILTRHETSAAFMADAMGSLSGIPGVCLATLGPGATNLVTGVAHAHLDRSPVIALAGQLPVDRYEIVTHQKLDLGAIFAPITKWHARVTPSNAIPVTARAIRVATRHRPGPVFLELPSDVPRSDAREASLDTPTIDVATRLDPGAADRAGALVRAAERPVILAGLDALRGCAGEELRALAERWAIPVMVSPKAKGVFREDHPLFLGTIEMLGTGKLFEYIDRCDVVIMAGFEPVELDRDWTATARVVHLGPLPNDDLYYPSHAEVVAPVSVALAALTESLGAPRHARDPGPVAAFRREFVEYVSPARGALTSQQVLAELRRTLPEDAIVTCDVGYNKAVTGQCWPVYLPNTFFMSNGLSSMGYGLPAALGLQLLRPDARVACILGDGGFAMLLGELETAVRRALPVTIVVLVDDALSQIRAGQERKGMPATGTMLRRIDHVALAKAFGAVGRDAETVAECRDAFEWAARQTGPRLIAAYVDPSGYQLGPG
jgi:acetolactate synthase-1/2/3 large subunit